MFSAVWRLDSHATGRTMSTFSIYSPGVSDAVSYGPQATASGARCPRQAFSLHLRARRALRRRRQLLQGRAEGVPCSAADQVQEREGRGVVARAPGAQFPNLEVMARQYLGCPATSATVERLFSKVGVAFSDKRKSSEAKTLANIAFAQANLPCETVLLTL